MVHVTISAFERCTCIISYFIIHVTLKSANVKSCTVNFKCQQVNVDIWPSMTQHDITICTVIAFIYRDIATFLISGIML